MGRGGRDPPSREVQVSKKISWLLRHGAEKEGLKLGHGGYVSVQEVVSWWSASSGLPGIPMLSSNGQGHGFQISYQNSYRLKIDQLANRNIRSLKVTFDEIQAIVADNDKQRFSLIPVPEYESIAAGKSESEALSNAAPDIADLPARATAQESKKPQDYLIRANQGHSLAVESEGLLTPITEDDIPETVVHGTTHGVWPLIVATGGLKPMTRNHVHFATGLPAGFKSIIRSQPDDHTGEPSSDEAAPVISGMRNSSSLLVYIDVRKAMAGGLKFWRSENGVVLCEGNDECVIGLQYFRSVEDRTGEVGVLVQDGHIVKEAPESWAKKGTGRRGGIGGGHGRGGRGG